MDDDDMIGPSSTSRVTFRRLKQTGTIRKQVRENYIRSDIVCMVKDCPKCPHTNLRQGNWLSTRKICVPSLETLQNYLDIFESDVTDIVIAQTIWRELQYTTGGSFRRLRRLLEDPRRRIVVFPNENFASTWVERSGEPWEEYCERLVQKTAEWYQEHVSSFSDSVVMWIRNTNVESPIAISIEDFVDIWHPELRNLLDNLLISRGVENEESLLDEMFGSMAISDDSHAEYWSMDAVEKAKSSVNLGVMRVNSHDTSIATVGDVTVSDANRAIHGDSVAITPNGTVVSVISRSGRPYVCTLQKDHDSLYVPVDRRIPKIKARSKVPESLIGIRVVLRIDGWFPDSKYPHGHIVRRVGPAGDHDVETEVLLIENEMDTHPPYESALLRSLAPLLPDWGWEPTEISGFRDFRSLRVFSIDPQGSMDIDDTMHVRRLSDARVEIGVHIAHVSHFVRPGSLLDIEAKARSTTLYLVDSRRDMIPPVLSEDVCSLRSGVDRLAMSVVWTIEENKVVDTWFGESIVHSLHSLHYQQAQDILDTGYSDLDEQLPDDLRIIAGVAKSWRRERIDAGALELESAELRFQLDSNKIIAVLPQQNLEVNAMVAELMIKANVSVAQYIYDQYPHSSLLRCHSAPPDTRIVDDLIGQFGLTMKTDSNLAMQASLKQAESRLGESMVLVKSLATQVMAEAAYISSAGDDHGHYGLAVPIYTHFTSPIRRYADIVVHRMLIAALNKARPVLSSDDVDTLVEHVNTQHRNAKKLQRASQELFLSLFVRNSREIICKGIVYMIYNKSIGVFLPKFKVKGIAHLVDRDGNSLLPSSLFGDDGDGLIPITSINADNGALHVIATDGRDLTIRKLDEIAVSVQSRDSDYRTPSFYMRITGSLTSKVVDISMPSKAVDSHMSVYVEKSREESGIYDVFADFETTGHEQACSMNV